MLKAIVGAITASALTGISVLAYRHPAAFETLVWPLVVAGFFVAGAVLVWNVAVQRTVDEIGFKKRDDGRSASEISRGLMIPSWVLALACCASLYVVFLLWLPVILRE